MGELAPGNRSGPHPEWASEGEIAGAKDFARVSILPEVVNREIRRPRKGWGRPTGGVARDGREIISLTDQRTD